MPRYESPLMTVDEVAEYMKVKKSWVYQVLRHEVPVIEIARQLRFEKRVIDAYLESHREAPVR